jgi:hypothetical protein
MKFVIIGAVPTRPAVHGGSEALCRACAGKLVIISMPGIETASSSLCADVQGE